MSRKPGYCGCQISFRALFFGIRSPLVSTTLHSISPTLLDALTFDLENPLTIEPELMFQLRSHDQAEFDLLFMNCFVCVIDPYFGDSFSRERKFEELECQYAQETGDSLIRKLCSLSFIECTSPT
jgi:hypothetical protein